MFILFISTERAWQGGEEQLRLLAEGARRAGHTCQIAARRSSQAHQQLQATGFDVVPLAGNVRGPRAAWQLRRMVQASKPDLIFANDPHALTLMRWGALGMHFPAKVATRRVLFPIRSPRKYARGCHAVVAVSHAIAEVCRNSGVPKSLLHVIHDGVDPARMQSGNGNWGRQSLELASDVPMILCVASLVECKGHRHLLDAFPAVLQSHPDAVLVLAGDGPLRGELQSQARSLAIDRQVRLLGYRHDVADLINACDVFVLPSLEEGLGTSVLDALFCEKPVVATSAGGLPEMLRDQRSQPCGWMVPPGEPEALAGAITEALANRTESQLRARRGNAWALEEFTAQRMVARTLALFEQLLARHREVR